MIFTHTQIVMDSPAKRIMWLMIQADNMKRKDLAKKIDRSAGLISDYLNGKAEIPDPFLLLLQDKLNWSAKWIKSGIGNQYVVPHHGSHNFINQDGQFNTNRASIGEESNSTELIELRTENKMLREQVELLKDLLKGKQ